MFSDSSPNTFDGSLDALYVAMVVKLSGGGVGSRPVALDHVIRQMQAGTSRCRIFLESLDFAMPPPKRSAGSGLPTKVPKGASRLGIYGLLRLTALRRS